MAKCIIEGCTNPGRHNVTVRCRRPNTSAIWAPNSNAYLCDNHADQGCTIEMHIKPNETKTITTNISGGGESEIRTSQIAHLARE